MNARKLTILSMIAALAMVFAAAAVVQDSGDSAAEGENYNTLTVGDGEYATVSAALEKAGDGDHIQLTADINENVIIENGKNVVLDLNGHKLTNVSSDTITVALGAGLTITGNGTVDNITNGKADVFNNGTVVIENGKFTRSLEAGTIGENHTNGSANGNSYYTVLNHGIMTIENGTFENSGSFSSLIENGYYTYGSTDPRSGHVEGINAANPELTITGGSFTGGKNTVKNDDGGVLTINNGTFTNSAQDVLLNWNEATINGGNFVASGDAFCTVNNGPDAYAEYDAGTLIFNGGTFDGKIVIGAYTDNVSKAVDAEVPAPYGYKWTDEGKIAADQFAYTINCVDKNGNLLSTFVGKADYRSTIDAPIEDISGYTADSVIKTITISADESKNVVTYTYTINQYKVTYLVDGVAIEGVVSHDYKSEVAVAEKYTKTGYTVTDWSSDDVAIEDGKFTMPAKDVEIEATTAVNQYSYTVKYVDADGNEIADAATGKADYGATVEAPIITVDGYTAPATQGSVKITEVEADNVYTYTYSINSYGYTVKYVDADGNSIRDAAAAEAVFGTEVTPEVPAIDGYTAPAAQTITISFDETKNAVTYVYTINSYGYTVKYVDADGNEIADAADGKAVFGTEVTPEVPAIDGYTAPAAQTITIASDVSKNVVTYTYSINSYVLTYLTAGDVVLSELTVEYNSSVTAPADPVREGSYAFAGWFLNGSACTFPFEMPANDVTLVATWDVVIPDADSETDIISVNVDANGAPISSDSMQAIVSSAESDENVTLEVSIGSGITVVFDNAAIRNFGTGAAELTANEISSDELTDAVRNIVGDGTVYSISFGSNTNFGEGTATVTLPYALADGMDAAGLYIAYIYDGQVAETFDCTYSDDGTVTFTTGHFSTYAIMYEEPSDDNDDEFIFALIVAVVIVIAVFGAVFLAQRSGKY